MRPDRRMEVAIGLIESAIESYIERDKPDHDKYSQTGSKAEIYNKLKIARKELLNAMKEFQP